MVFDLITSEKLFKCVYRLTKVHRNYSFEAYV